jgi:hypothetical protein
LLAKLDVGSLAALDQRTFLGQMWRLPLES